jgi:ABC-type glycerol-3-phosphate transport system permease component
MARARSTSGERYGRASLRGIVYVILSLGAVVMILPFAWMLSTSVMTLGEANAGRLLPRVARLSCPHVNLAKVIEGSVTEFRVLCRDEAR